MINLIAQYLANLLPENNLRRWHDFFSPQHKKIHPLGSEVWAFCGVSPLNLYPIIRLSFKGNQLYFRTIRKYKIEGLPAM